MSGFEELAPLYDVAEDAVAVVLIGGPWDGQERRVPMGGRSWHDVMVSLLCSYSIELPPSRAIRVITEEEIRRNPFPPSRCDYRLLLDEVSQPSRDDAGRMRLGFRGIW